MTIRLRDAGGTLRYAESSGENQEKPTPRVIGTLPKGIIYVSGTVTNGSVAGKNLAGLGMVITDSTGFPAWTTLLLT